MNVNQKHKNNKKIKHDESLLAAKILLHQSEIIEKISTKQP